MRSKWSERANAVDLRVFAVWTAEFLEALGERRIRLSVVVVVVVVVFMIMLVLIVIRSDDVGLGDVVDLLLVFPKSCKRARVRIQAQEERPDQFLRLFFVVVHFVVDQQFVVLTFRVVVLIAIGMLHGIGLVLVRAE